MSDKQRVSTNLLHRTYLSLGITLVFLLVALFVPAGDIRWTEGWAFLAVFFGLMIVAIVYLWRVNPEIFAARSKIQEGTKTWDKVLIAFLMCAIMAIFPVAGLDASRFHWSSVPLGLTVFGHIAWSIGFLITCWVGAVNKFAEPGVRIHAEQKVIEGGPYAVVRHPMYLGTILLFVGIPLSLGSYWAFVPAVLATLVLLIRTAMEDKALHGELQGYPEYASRVRYRLFPGVW